MSFFDVFRTIQIGAVIDKGHYDMQGNVTRLVMTEFNKNREVEFIPVAPIPEGWSLIVKGKDKSDKHEMVKEIYVSQRRWNFTNVGDTYKKDDPMWPDTQEL
jgi:hypothetical protein